MQKPIKPDNLLRNTIDKVTSPLQNFLQLEASSGIVLVLIALFAMIFANSSFLSEWYFQFINLPIKVAVAGLALEKTLLLLVNDGLMAIFFFLVGLEIKRELLAGELSSPKKASFAIIAAIGGMAAPALFFIFLNPSSPAINGWGIPMATDIAFALGVLALLGKRVPASLKVFLLALAIVDDLGAISIIALFYTSEIATGYLGVATMALFLLALLNYAGFRNIVIGITLGLVTWFCFLKSGVHATLAGVILAFLTPSRPIQNEQEPKTDNDLLLDHYIHALHPWVAFFIMPVFAFFNAGVAIVDVHLTEVLFSSISLGVIAGLVLGKPVGVALATFLAVKLGWTRLPDGATWVQIIAVGFIAGIGFTMSLFISSLAYAEPTLVMQSKVGILAASLTAGLLGLLLLWLSTNKSEPRPD